MPQQPAPTESDRQRARARRTVVVMAVIAGGIYVAFILSGVLGR